MKEKKIYFQFGLFSGLMFILFLLSSYTLTEIENDGNNTDNEVLLPQLITSVNLNREWSFAGERVPMNIDTKERLERELIVNSYFHSATLLNLKKTTRFFPVIEKILREEGVPTDFKYLAVAESNLSNVTSPSNARGYWQFMKNSVSEFGLEVNDEVDERNHLEKSTRAAAKYLKQLYNRFGSWTNAAAAYNIGPSKYEKLMIIQGETDYYNLHLNEETSRYVFRLIAIKEILSNPLKYGYKLSVSDRYEPHDFKEVTVTESINSLSDFAHQYGISYRMLKYYNPWLISDRLIVKGKTYVIRIPKKK